MSNTNNIQVGNFVSKNGSWPQVFEGRVVSIKAGVYAVEWLTGFTGEYHDDAISLLSAERQEFLRSELQREADHEKTITRRTGRPSRGMCGVK